MLESYAESARRHYADAKSLAVRDRLDNAGHLIGFATECAIKHAFELSEPKEWLPRVHLPSLANVVLKRVTNRKTSSIPLRKLLEQTRNQFFTDWDVNDRYRSTGHVSRTKYQRWCKLAKRALHAAGIRQ